MLGQQLMAWVPAPVNSPWRGQVYKRDLEEEARLDDKLSAAKAAAEARAARPLSEAETYWSKRKEPGAGDLCRARAVRAFEAVERVEALQAVLTREHAPPRRLHLVRLLRLAGQQHLDCGTRLLHRRLLQKRVSWHTQLLRQ